MRSSNLTAATLIFVSVVSFSCGLTNREIDKFYRQINPPAVHEFKDPKEGIILCVKWSVFHQSHAEEEARDGHPLIFKGDPSNSCPEGTVPVVKIPRTNVESHLKASELKKRSSLLLFNATSFSNQSGTTSTSTRITDPLVDDGNNEIHEYAIVQQTGQFYAASARFEIWRPDVRDPGPGIDEFSVAQMWVAGGYNHPTMETIEAGWQVHPEKFRDQADPSQPRFFLFYARNQYETRCYNLECSTTYPEESFRPVRPDHIIGRSLNEISEMNRRRYIPITIVKGEVAVGNGQRAPVWLIYAADKLQGFINATFFPNHLHRGFAEEVHIGGEVGFYERRGGEGEKPPHSPTDMGNGYYGSSGPPHAAIIGGMRVFDAPRGSYSFNNAPLRDFISKAGCYNSYHITNGRQREMFYGGPGYHPQNCP